MRLRRISKRHITRYALIKRNDKDSWLTAILALQLAKKWHPDTNKDKAANEKFMEIQAAYDVSTFQIRHGAVTESSSCALTDLV